MGLESQGVGGRGVMRYEHHGNQVNGATFMVIAKKPAHF
jgi:hypothetical protein